MTTPLTRRGAMAAAAAGLGATLPHQARAELADAPAVTVTPFLTFQGGAQKAIDLYLKTFGDAEVVAMERYTAAELPPNSIVEPGAVKFATVRLAGSRVFVIDSPLKHAWDFTPGVSLMVECQPAEVDRFAEQLADGGKVLMPIDEYPFAKRFGWVEDAFGVSWQLMAR